MQSGCEKRKLGYQLLRKLSEKDGVVSVCTLVLMIRMEKCDLKRAN